MLLKLLEKLGRKKVVLDRGPSHPKFKDAKPWMNRYYVLFRNRPKWFPFNILVHEMLDDDHGDGVHNHLFPFITIILRGGYYETLKDGKHSPGLEESFETKLYAQEEIPWDELAFPIITENLKLFFEKEKTDKPHTGTVDKIGDEYKIIRS